MNIIAGKRRGAKIAVPEGLNVRPTLVRCREALFSMLLSEIQTFEGTNILDPFAGSGALGLEAWSRGASQVVFIEANSAHLGILKSNIQKLQANAECRALAGRTPEALRQLKGMKFDVVMLDPPYNDGLLEPTLKILSEFDLLAQNARISIEFEAGLAPEIPSGYVCIKDRKYGKAGLQILCRESDLSTEIPKHL